MAEQSARKTPRPFIARHRERGAQVWIYLGKLLRMFVYQSDWKVLPMAALIAGLVGMVVRIDMFLTMEGTLMGAFALVCVCIWNGCFNSIQVVCRERAVIKREHRSGMHISSYVFAHMLYQLLLCIFQTGITLYVIRLVGVQFPQKGLITPWMIVDIGISMLLITYASDMLSLWVSTLARTTTTAMTIMPFVLIFQLVFSGGMLTLPAWTESLTGFTISNPGLKVIAAQAETNTLPFVTISDMIGKMRGNTISGEITTGQALDLLSNADNPTIAQLRGTALGVDVTVGEIRDLLYGSAALKEHRNDALNGEMTLGDVLDLMDESGIWEKHQEDTIQGSVTLGEIIDRLAENPDIQARRDDSHAFSVSLGGLIDIVGEEKVNSFLEEKAAAASYKPEFDHTEENVFRYWLHLAAFIAVFALLSTITLEFIDKDKR